ncbi:MAG: DNA-processing protein DprA, partial [Rhodothermales bacterium]
MSPSLFEDDGRLTVEDEEAEERALISLSLVPGVGPGRIRAVLARFRSAVRALKASPRALAEVPGVGPQTAQAIAAFDGERVAEEQLRRAEHVGAWLLPLWDVRFPRLLQQIYDPPAFLWVRGSLVPEDERAIAIVGTRRATEYGRSAAHDLAQALAERGLTVVSGLAYGIDGAAHRGALVPPSGRTLTVLGSGVDRIYPARHTRLAEAIEERGAILSEYPMGAAPDGPNFPRRNR